MLGDHSPLLGGGGNISTPNMTAEGGGGGGVGSNSESDIERSRIEEGERNFGGNRWPRPETLALLRIRSDMDTVFRDASVKGPLWDEVSRKLAELGFYRSAKKCKEKFENVYKYHKRTKDGRGGKSDGKTYRFFDQLEALDHFHNHPSTYQQSYQPQNQSRSPQISASMSTPTQTQTPSQVVTAAITESTTVPMSLPPVINTAMSIPPHVTVSSISVPQNNVVTTQTQTMNMNQAISSINPSTSFQLPPTNPTTTTNPLPSFPNISTDLLSNSMASSYSTSSEDTTEEGSRKRKRKWKDFFERLMKEVIEKQEDLQKRFLEAIEKREQEKVAREEAWRAQEMLRITREREILAQERSIAAAKDAAVMSFLQKIAEQQNLGETLNNINIAQPPPPQQLQRNATPTPPPPPVLAPAPAPTTVSTATAAPAPAPGPAPAPTPTPTQALAVKVHAPPPLQPPPVTKPSQPIVPQQQLVMNREIVKLDNNGESFMGASPSRWPKVEVEALINLRTSMDNKYQENGPKGPLWEDISSAMRNLGYNRNAKRCKEKWENINKYFKKVKESNKKRPEDSKTCPYFHQLDALYREKGKGDNSGGSGSGSGLNPAVKAENMAAPLMVRPEQQWPPQQEERNRREEEDDMDEDDRDREEDMDESGSGGGNFEIEANKPAVGASA